jgi:hypothetical protein
VVMIGVGGCGDGRNARERVTDPCLRFTSCGDCTPVRGCGWCAHGDAAGVCLRDPIECPGPQFTWTWEPVACTPGQDGGATPSEAGVSDGDGGMCRWPAAANTFTSADAGLSGCLPSTGGNLCASPQFTLTCHGNGTSAPSVPDPALKCTVVPVPTPSGVLFYCCPCSGG